MWSWQLFTFFITYVEIYGDFTEAYRIVIAYTEIEIHIVKREHVFSGYKPYTVKNLVKSVAVSECQWKFLVMVTTIYSGSHYLP